MKVIIGVIIFVFVIVSGFQVIEKWKTNSLIGDVAEKLPNIEDNQEDIIQVSITGNVRSPGIYQLESGSFLMDALDLAGGALTDTDYSAINIYLYLVTDISLYIPKISENKISINNATNEEMKQLPSIGSILASRIIDYRESIGKFAYLEQIMEVSGIGTSIFNQIKDKIIL